MIFDKHLGRLKKVKLKSKKGTFDELAEQLKVEVCDDVGPWDDTILLHARLRAEMDLCYTEWTDATPSDGSREAIALHVMRTEAASAEKHLRGYINALQAYMEEKDADLL